MSDALVTILKPIISNNIPFCDARKVTNVATDLIYNEIVEGPYRVIAKRIVDIIWDIAKNFCGL